jgi:hypothetical protein
VVTATDADTGAGELVYSGSVNSCGTITGSSTTLSCPNIMPYSGTITVTDPDANSDSQAVSFEPCTDGSAP